MKQHFLHFFVLHNFFMTSTTIKPTTLYRYLFHAQLALVYSAASRVKVG